MAKVKILLHIEGGNIQWTASNHKDVEIIVTDADLQEIGDDAISIRKPDLFVPDGIFSSVTFDDDKVLKDELKKLGY